MANFMQKERIEVQGSGAYGAENLSKDLFGLMSAVSGTVKAVDKSMVAESKDIGEALARDSILEMVRKKNAYDQQIAENPNDFGYQDAKNDMDIFVAQKMSDVKDRLGSDSVAYKAFEDGFLMNGTKYTEEYKTDLFQKYQAVERKKGIESEMQVVNETTNALGAEGVVSSHKRFKQLGLTDEQSSKYYTDTFLGKFQQAELDPKKLYDGATINRQREIAEFNKYYGSIATMNSDGSIQGKHGFLQQDDLGRIKSSWEAKTNIVKEKNENNIALYLEMDKQKEFMDKSLPSNPQQATEQLTSVLSSVDAVFSQASSPSNSDTKAYLLFRQNMKQKYDEFNVAFGVATSDPISVGRAISTGQNNNGVKVDTSTVKRLVVSSLDYSIDDALKNGNLDAIKKIAQYESQTGIQSTVASKFNTLVDINKANSTEQLKTNFKNASLLLQGGYTHGNEKLNKEMIDEYLGIITSSENKGLDFKATKDLLNEKRNDFTLTNITKAPEYLDNNTFALNKFTAMDDKMQSALGFGSSLVAGEVKVNRGTKTNSFQEFGGALAKALTGAGIRLDSNRPIDEGDNLQKIKDSKYIYVIDNPFWNAELVLLPDVVDGQTKRPIEGAQFFDGVKNAISITKQLGFEQVDMDKVRTEPVYNSSSGLKTKVYYDGVAIGTFSGNEISEYYLKVDTKDRVKTQKDSFEFLSTQY